MAPLPTPEGVGVRGRASRPTFRRGGLVFDDRNWTPVDPEEIGEAAVLAILTEPVLTLQARGPDGEWAIMPEDIRVHLADALRQSLAEGMPSGAQ